MLAVPPDLRQSYDQLLARRSIPDHHRPHYHRWLRFYLDFCAKYRHPTRDRRSLLGFVDKLREKNQAEWMCRQATDAVGLYLDLGRDENSPRTVVVAAPGQRVTGANEPPDRQPVGPRAASQRSSPSGPEALNSSPVGFPDTDLAPSSPKAQVKPGRAYPPRVLDPPPAHAPPRPPAARPDPMPEQARATAVPVLPANWPDLHDQLAAAIKLRHYSPKTLKSYSIWVRKFQGYTRGKAPPGLAVDDVKSFLTFLAVERNVSASTQNQAFNALLFLFRQVLGKEFGKVEGVVRAKKRPYIPTVMSRDEVDRVIALLPPPCDLAAKLLYGCGLRLFECLKLRVQDVDFDMRVLTVHDGKGQKDRALPLPEVSMPELRAHLDEVIWVHRADLAVGFTGTFLPGRLEQKYPSAARDLAWQWFFPATKLTAVPGTGEQRRYHLHETVLQKAFKMAVRQAGIPKRATPHTLRHSYASHLLQAGYDIRTIQELLGHSDVKTTMIYTHTVRSQSVKEAKSPLDF